MTERSRDAPRLSAKGRGARAARETRLAEALRANLHKRKAQARGRAGAVEDAAPEAAPTAAPDPSRAPGDEA